MGDSEADPPFIDRFSWQTRGKPLGRAPDGRRANVAHAGVAYATPRAWAHIDGTPTPSPVFVS